MGLELLRIVPTTVIATSTIQLQRHYRPLLIVPFLLFLHLLRVRPPTSSTTTIIVAITTANHDYVTPLSITTPIVLDAFVEAHHCTSMGDGGQLRRTELEEEAQVSGNKPQEEPWV